MRSTSRIKRAFLALLLVTTSAAAIPAASQAVATDDPPDHVVHAGATDPTDGTSVTMFEAYFPSHLQVHRGDRVRWEFPNQRDIAQAFHTVTFGNADELPYVRTDELDGVLAFDERTLFTSGCGRPGQPICVISSLDDVVSSGAPIQHSGGVGKIHSFEAIIDLPVGTYTYFCTLHHPDMQGTIEVVADDVALHNPTPEDLAGEIAMHAEHARSTFADLSRPNLTIEEDGRRVWTIHAGAGTPGDVRVSTETFLPASLEIRAGDTVRWVMGGTVHTVTFPDTSGGLGPPQHLTANCEYDGASTGLPGVSATTLGAGGLPWCPPGGSLELTLTPLADEQRAPNDAVTPATLHNSGLMIGGHLPERMRGRPAGSGRHFPSDFEATFPLPGTYVYRCLMHYGFMSGSITVR